MSTAHPVANAKEDPPTSTQAAAITSQARLFATHLSPTYRLCTGNVYCGDKALPPSLKGWQPADLQEVQKNLAAWARYNSYLELKKKETQGLIQSSASRENSDFNVLNCSPGSQRSQGINIQISDKSASAKKLEGINVSDKSQTLAPVTCVNSESVFATLRDAHNPNRRRILDDLLPARENLNCCSLQGLLRRDSQASVSENKENCDFSSDPSGTGTLLPTLSKKFPVFHKLLCSSQITCNFLAPLVDAREEIRQDILRKLHIELNEESKPKSASFKKKMNVAGKRHYQAAHPHNHTGRDGGHHAKRRRSGPGPGSHQGFHKGREAALGGSHGGGKSGQGSVNGPIPDATMHMASDFIMRMYNQKKQTAESFQRKMELRGALFNIIQTVFPGCGLYIVGSSMNGFGTVHSDMDMCLMLAPNMVITKSESVKLLKQLHKRLRKCNYLKEMMVIKAKVPILKFKDRISGLECDININNEAGIRNTHLLNAYSKFERRVKPLVLFVKMWAKYHNINDASQSTISSYSLSLMVIHYLQCACDPPVLPSLQRTYPNVFNPDQDVRMLTLNQQLPEFSSPNKQSVGELFMGFLQYYINYFDRGDEVISVRLAGKISKDDAIQQSINDGDDLRQWKFICIEEPFNLANVAKSVYDQHKFQRICRVFRTSLARFRMTGKLESLLDQPI